MCFFKSLIQLFKIYVINLNLSFIVQGKNLCDIVQTTVLHTLRLLLYYAPFFVHTSTAKCVDLEQCLHPDCENDVVF